MTTGEIKKNVVIIGAGTGGIIVANRLSRRVGHSVQITVIEPSGSHYFQPGFLSVPFGRYRLEQLCKPVRSLLPAKVNLVKAAVESINVKNSNVRLVDGRYIHYDVLVIASGVRGDAFAMPGLSATAWRDTIHDFYSPDGALALKNKLDGWHGGNLVVHITEVPIKCPVAPLEFCFLADAWLRQRGKREKTKLYYVTPMSGAFTRPQADKVLSYLLKEHGIEVVPDFGVERVDSEARELIGYDGRRVAYDLLVTVPTNKGADFINNSGLGDELNFVPVDRFTLQAKGQANVFVIGDASNVPTSKAGSTAHFEATTIVNNVMHSLAGEELEASFDGHANCFVETGDGKALLLDLNYEAEPVIGKFPWPVIGPLSLLKESRINYWAKLSFRWIYWHILLRGRHIIGVTDKKRKLA